LTWAVVKGLGISEEAFCFDGPEVLPVCSDILRGVFHMKVFHPAGPFNRRAVSFKFLFAYFTPILTLIKEKLSRRPGSPAFRRTWLFLTDGRNAGRVFNGEFMIDEE
jgi:hypothetical protein